MSIIDVNNLTHTFTDGSAGLDGLSLTVEQGEFVVLAGPNGSGKTTLLRHLNGLLLPTSGSVAVDGVQVTSKTAALARRAVGLVFQDADSQIVGETVYDDVVFGPENLGWDRAKVREAAQEAMEAVGLTGMEERPPHLLSGGEKRRLAIAGVLAMGSNILALDEPLANLDYPGLRLVLERIVALHGQGRTIVLATHDIEKVAAHAGRLVVMEQGRIVEDGPTERIASLVERHGVRPPCATLLGAGFQSWLS